jgi:hypothetical protein
LPAFFEELESYLDGMGQPLEKLGEVSDIRVEGDTAVGHGKQDLPPPLDLPVSIHFCKIDGCEGPGLVDTGGGEIMSL